VRFLPIAVCLLVLVQCCSIPNTPKLGVIAVSVQEVGNYTPINGIRVDVLQTNQTKMTDSTGVAAFEVNPGTYTLRVYNLQLGGPVIRSIDSIVTVMAGQADTVKYLECLACR